MAPACVNNPVAPLNNTNPLPIGRRVPCPAPAAAAPAARAGAPRAAAPPPPPNPVTLALTYWHTVPLPKPKPTVPPGWAITGLPAYLVTDGSTAAAYNTNTVLGRLHLAAHGTYWVQWNDPAGGTSWQGPYSSEGQPYPTGAITHTYDNVGSYAVIVRETWTATWTLGPAHGVLAGLATQATIPDLNVQQIQAVITNN